MSAGVQPMEQPKSIVWEGVYPSLREVPVEGPGFDGDEWIRNSLKKIQAFRKEAERNAPLPPPSNYRECLLPLLAALIYREKAGVRVLDYGGSLGFAYYQLVSGLPCPQAVDYHIVERDAVCEEGRNFFGAATRNLQFHSCLPDSGAGFDVVFAGSSIHYISDWKQILTDLCALEPRYLLLADVPAGNIPTFATAQIYYRSRIPAWFLNIGELLEVPGGLGYELAFKSVYLPTVLSAEHELPMHNFEPKYRLRYSCNLLFVPGRARTSTK